MRTSRMSKFSLSAGLVVMMAALTACDKGGGVSILSAEENFKVSLSAQPRPIDILWVVDNSGSMASSQQNLASNFNAFIQDFVALKYDFRMAVTTTDVWYNQYNSSNAFYSPRWRTGNRADIYNPQFADQGAPTNSGVFVMDKDTPSINSVFTTNAKVGTQGNGDERPFASFRRALNHAANNDFRRNNAFLAIIIVSDEEDFSRTDSTSGTSYSDPKLLPVSDFVTYLDTLTNSNSDNRKDNYQVNAITIMSDACLQTLNDSTQRKSIRIPEIADLTGGSKNSLCDPFNAVLDNIKESVITAAAVFKLDREPKVDSIVVKINGTAVAAGASTWSYESVTNSVRFAPAFAQSVSADANIQITYDPTTLK